MAKIMAGTNYLRQVNTWVSVFTGGRGDNTPGSGVVLGHHLHPFAKGILLFDGGYGLIQPPCHFVGVVQYTRR